MFIYTVTFGVRQLGLCAVTDFICKIQWPC